MAKMKKEDAAASGAGTVTGSDTDEMEQPSHLSCTNSYVCGSMVYAGSDQLHQVPLVY